MYGYTQPFLGFGGKKRQDFNEEKPLNESESEYAFQVRKSRTWPWILVIIALLCSNIYLLIKRGSGGAVSGDGFTDGFSTDFGRSQPIDGLCLACLD